MLKLLAFVIVFSLSLYSINEETTSKISEHFYDFSKENFLFFYKSYQQLDINSEIAILANFFSNAFFNNVPYQKNDLSSELDFLEVSNLDNDNEIKAVINHKLKEKAFDLLLTTNFVEELFYDFNTKTQNKYFLKIKFHCKKCKIDYSALFILKMLGALMKGFGWRMNIPYDRWQTPFFGNKYPNLVVLRLKSRAITLYDLFLNVLLTLDEMYENYNSHPIFLKNYNFLKEQMSNMYKLNDIIRKH